MSKSLDTHHKMTPSANEVPLLISLLMFPIPEASSSKPVSLECTPHLLSQATQVSPVWLPDNSFFGTFHEMVIKIGFQHTAPHQEATGGGCLEIPLPLCSKSGDFQTAPVPRNTRFRSDSRIAQPRSCQCTPSSEVATPNPSPALRSVIR